MEYCFLFLFTIWVRLNSIHADSDLDDYQNFTQNENVSEESLHFEQETVTNEYTVHGSLFGIVRQNSDESDNDTTFSLPNQIRVSNETNILAKNVPEVFSTDPLITQVHMKDYNIQLKWWQVLLIVSSTLLFLFNCLYFTKCCYLTVDCCADPYWCCCPSSKIFLKLVKPLPKRKKSKKKITLQDISIPVSVNKTTDPLEESAAVVTDKNGVGQGKPPIHTRVKESPVSMRRNKNSSRGTSPIQILKRPYSQSDEIRQSSLSLRSSSTLLINRATENSKKISDIGLEKNDENINERESCRERNQETIDEPPSKDRTTIKFNTMPQTFSVNEMDTNTVPIKIIKEGKKTEKNQSSNFGRSSNFTWMRSLSLNRSKKCKISSRNLSRARSSSYSRTSEYQYIADFQSSIVVATKLTKKTSTLSSYQAKPLVFKRSRSTESLESIESENASEIAPNITQSEKHLPNRGKSPLRLEGRSSGMSFSRRSTPVTCPTTPLMMDYNFQTFEKSLSLSKETCL